MRVSRIIQSYYIPADVDRKGFICSQPTPLAVKKINLIPPLWWRFICFQGLLPNVPFPLKTFSVGPFPDGCANNRSWGAFHLSEWQRYYGYRAQPSSLECSYQQQQLPICRRQGTADDDVNTILFHKDLRRDCESSAAISRAMWTPARGAIHIFRHTIETGAFLPYVLFRKTLHLKK